ncbi:hypothetical protein EC991_002233, partial [Linnemannia zychae]
MNSDTGYPASSKGRSNREESNMNSGHSSHGSKAEPMRVAAMRPNDSEFRVAEREDGGIAQNKAPQHHEPFNAPAHQLHGPLQALAVSKPVASAPKSTLSKAFLPTRTHHDPFSAPANPVHAHGQARIAPVQAPKLKASAPKQNPGSSQAEGIDHYAHPTPEEEIDEQQHAENRQRGNSHGHHAIA